MRREFSDQGIIVKQIRYSEADKFITILTSEHGLIRLLAKGARRSTSRRSAHLDPLNLIKFQALQTDSILLLQQAEEISSYSQIKNDLKKIESCFLILELFQNLLAEGQVDTPLFLSFRNYLDTLNSKDFTTLDTQFLHYLIKHLGFPPPPTDDILSYLESLIDRPLKSPGMLS